MISTLLLLAALAPPAQEADDPGAAWNVSLVTDNVPDLTDLDRYLASITSQFEDPQDQAISIWRWSQRLRKQTTNPIEDGHYVLDPIALFNSYGHCNCGIISGLNNTMWTRMGWKPRYVQLGDHTVCEVSFDGGRNWHMFDSSMSIYCFNDKGRVASTTEIEKNPRFYLENYAPSLGTNPNGWRCAADQPVHYRRTLANGVDSFKAPNSLQESNLYVRWGRRYVLNLRPHEHYTRHFDNLDAEKPSPRYYRPLKGRKSGDIEDQHQHKNIRANGAWKYAPDLRSPSAARQAYSHRDVLWSADPRHPAVRTRSEGHVIYKVYAANVVTSARLKLRAVRATSKDSVTVSVSRDHGRNWAEAGPGEVIELGEAVAGLTQYLVRIDLAGPGAGLNGLEIETITQINRFSMPRLTRGANRIQVRTGRPVETIFWMPSVRGGAHRRTVHEEKDVQVNKEPGFYKATLRAGKKDAPGRATWKLEAPTPLIDLVYGGNVCVKSDRDRVTLLHSWDGKKFTRDYEKKDGSMPWDLMVNVPVRGIPENTRTAYVRYEFNSPAGGGTYNAAGIQTATLTAHHRPRLAKFAPIEVTYCWTEHRDAGDVTRTHTELGRSAAHEYAIHVGGYRDPTMRWVRMNLEGHGPEKVRPGYSDGKDVGPGAEPVRRTFRWGRNLAKGRRYAVEGAQSERNPDAGGDLTDGVIAPPSEYVSRRYMPTNVMFAKDVSPGITVDLEANRTVAAVRVFAGQPEPVATGGYRFAYPDEITVETSLDGKTFARAGAVGHHQVFDPPADYVPWELDDAAQYASLPAGGRLHYGYRILLKKPVAARYVRVRCASRKGWGVLLSEIQVFDRVEIDRDVPPAVVLPPLGK